MQNERFKSVLGKFKHAIPSCFWLDELEVVDDAVKRNQLPMIFLTSHTWETAMSEWLRNLTDKPSEESQITHD